MGSENTLDAAYRGIFAKNLIRYLALHQQSQLEVANKLGIKQSTFSSWCTGQKMPRMDKIEMLADYFGILKSDLIEEKPVTESDELTDEDMEYIKIIKSLTPEQQKLLDVFLTGLQSNQ